MSEKMYFHLLFLCGILCQGIFATLSDKDTKLSSDFLVRNRRVINHLPDGRIAPRMESVNYIVRIKENNRNTCAGAILSHYTVITAASCIRDHLSAYQVQSGVARAVSYNLHNITSNSEQYGNAPTQLRDGISLITVDPPFQFDTKTSYINLYIGPVATRTQVTVTGWGYLYPIQPGTELRQRLRQIRLPIMDLRECELEYRNRFPISQKHICTYCPNQYCAHADVGAPLVINNELAGIHVWKGENAGQRNPDVYVNLQNPSYKQWIRDNTILI